VPRISWIEEKDATGRLAELFEDARAGLRTIEFRAVNPLFEGLPVTIAGVADNERIEMTAVRNDRAVAMTSILT